MAWVGQYILDEDGNPVPEPDDLKWAIWFEHSHKLPGKQCRIVRQDHVGAVMISTVFLGLDHAFPRTDDAHEPVLWETMIFGGPEDEYQRRYTSREAAERGHIDAMMMIEPWAEDIRELNRMMQLVPEFEKKQ